ncbi:uncharacterized protein LOC131206676 [Anopheles bellator]|uniref:uncharacterized protein LOC131206676 n=1 Tax=Anopheles bellator TaxID=139047 RepID=UPI0026488005|nr:uncharacterized protein LOC131206676 [Anopheles bellator]
MHNEPALQTPREKPLPTTANGTGAIPTPENTNRTPLHEAASTGDEAKVETLLAAGADRNAKESVHGNTPLHEASWKGYSRCVKLLCALPKPAKPGVGGASGAKGLELLKDAAPSSSTKIKHAALHDTKGALHSALLGTRNFGGFSALHLAAQNGHNQSCREILLAGGDPDVQNNYGDSPLHTACRYGHAGAIRILLSAKCDFERINLNGDTALHIACAMGRRKLTRILLESGCRQDTKNAQDETARDIAQRKNLVEIINILNSPPPPPAPAPAAPNTDLSPRRSRERSSSSSHRKAPDCPDGRSSRPSKPAPGGTGEEGPAHRKSGRRRSNSNDDAKGGGAGAEVDPKHWSPYGCHYFPDPRNFPSPKLETLPKEPLGNGEQYFLDLAGNIRKGPVGVGNTCYCAPFFKHLEARMNQNRRSIRKYVHRATEKLDSRMTALAMRTDDQIEELTKSMIASRVQCENKRLHLEQWLKRGIAERSTTTTSGGGGGGGGGGGHPLQHTNSKTKKDEANTNTLTRCRSLELLDDHEDTHHHTLQAQQSTPVTGAVSTHPTKQLFSSRSIDFLDATGSTIDEEAHLRLLQYGSATGHQSDAFGGSSQHSNMKNHSDAASETPPLPPLGRRNRSSSICYSSDKDNDREKPPQPLPQPTTSGQQGKSEKAKVTERLEELLSKTKRILELEKLTKATGPGSPPVASARSDNRYILALDKLRDIHHYEPPLAGTLAGGRGHSPGAAGYDIAQEMEKITKSLLPATALDAATAPVSPEIAKDITTRKERPTAVYGLALAYGQPKPRGSPVCATSQPGSQPFVIDEEESHLGRTNFGHGESSGGGVVVNGFYSNSCFADETLPSSSCNTTIKRNPGTDPEEEDSPDAGEEEEEQDSDRGDDSDDDPRDSESDRADLSAMANLAELKELKSRILNGTNWRSQVLQKSVQELLLREGHEDRTRDEPAMGGDQVSGDDPTTDTNRVRYIISKLQQSVAGGHSNAPPLAQCEDFSDSSEDEDEDEHGNGEEDDDEDCVDGPLPVGRHPSDGAPLPIVEIGIGTAKSLIQMYEQSSSSSIGTGPPSKALPTIQGIPKDAYFHDLPRKPVLGASDRDGDIPPPMALASRSRNPLPSYLLQEAELFQQQQQQPGTYRATSMLNGNEGFLHHPAPPAPSQRHNHHHHHHHPHQSYPPVAAQSPPESERLLSTRKYINPAATHHQQRSLSSTATPSPEFPLHHQQPQQAQPQHSALGTATGVGTVIAGHSHAMMTMMAAAAAAAASRSKSADNLSNDDSGYVSGKVSEIHVPSGGASPLLSLPAGLANGAAGGNVLIIPPPASASPRHFLPSYPHHHHHHHHLGGMAGNGGGSVVTSIVPPPAPLGSGPPAPMTSAAAHAAVEQKQQSLYKLGASSLV